MVPGQGLEGICICNLYIKKVKRKLQFEYVKFPLYEIEAPYIIFACFKNSGGGNNYLTKGNLPLRLNIIYKR